MEATEQSRVEAMRLCALADGCNLLSVLLDFKTLEASCGAAARGALAADVRAIGSDLGLDASRVADAFDGCVGSSEQAYRQVRREHTRLFDDPDHPAVACYEGAFVNRAYVARGKQAPDVASLFINQAALDAARQYKRAGMRKAAGENVPGDAMFVELAYLGMLFARKAEEIFTNAPVPVDDQEAKPLPRGSAPVARNTDDMIDEFLRLHASVWMRDFFEELGAKAHEPYFKAVASLGGWMSDALEAYHPSAYAGRRR